MWCSSLPERGSMIVGACAGGKQHHTMSSAAAAGRCRHGRGVAHLLQQRQCDHDVVVALGLPTVGVADFKVTGRSPRSCCPPSRAPARSRRRALCDRAGLGQLDADQAFGAAHVEHGLAPYPP